MRKGIGILVLALAFNSALFANDADNTNDLGWQNSSQGTNYGSSNNINSIANQKAEANKVERDNSVEDSVREKISKGTIRDEMIEQAEGRTKRPTISDVRGEALKMQKEMKDELKKREDAGEELYDKGASKDSLPDDLKEKSVDDLPQDVLKSVVQLDDDETAGCQMLLCLAGIVFGENPKECKKPIRKYFKLLLNPKKAHKALKVCPVDKMLTSSLTQGLLGGSGGNSGSGNQQLDVDSIIDSFRLRNIDINELDVEPVEKHSCWFKKCFMEKTPNKEECAAAGLVKAEFMRVHLQMRLKPGMLSADRKAIIRATEEEFDRFCPIPY